MPLKLGEDCRTLRRFVSSSTGRWWAALLGRKCQSATEYTAAAPPDRDQRQEVRVCKKCVMKHEPFLNGASVAVSRPACPLCRIQRILLRASHLPTWDRDSKSKSLFRNKMVEGDQELFSTLMRIFYTECGHKDVERAYTKMSWSLLRLD